MTHASSSSGSSAAEVSSASLARLLAYLATDPENLPLRAEVFATALSLGDFAVAQQQTTWVLSRIPADFGWRHRLAILDMAQHEWVEAKLILQSLLDEGQTDPVIAYNLAYVDFACSRTADAAARLRPMLEVHLARVPDILPTLLRCLHRLGAIDEALALFERHSANTSTAEPFGVASLLAIDGNRIQRAKEWADRALALDPQQHEALVARATAALGERDASGAMRDLLLALRIHPTDGRTLSAIGMAQLLNTKLDDARDAFTQAVRHMPSHIGTWHGLGWCELLRKDTQAAQVAFDRALALDPNFGESHGGLAVVQALSGQTAAAEESIRRALGLDPAGLSARFAQAILNGDAHDPERFMRMARGALGQRRTADGKSLADVVLAKAR